MAKNSYLVCRDHNGRTCIKLEETQGLVKYVPMADLGFNVETTSVESFAQRYKPMSNYPIDKACQLYLGYCVTLGATDEVLDYLQAKVTITQEDREMAKAVASSREKTSGAKVASETKSPAKPKRKAAPKATAEKPAKKATKSVGEYRSAAQMFQALIMAGQHTDDEIFGQVQQAFDLDDKKRGYVKWYRNNLKKKGENPPEAK